MSFIPAIIEKIFEINPSFYVKQSTAEKVKILFFRRLGEGQGPGNNSIKF